MGPNGGLSAVPPEGGRPFIIYIYIKLIFNSYFRRTYLGMQCVATGGFVRS